MMHKLKDWSAANRLLLETTYGELHRRAEASWREVDTSSFLCEELERMGVPCRTFDDQTGIVAVWDEGEAGPTVALRADMDALPHERNGDRRFIHSCGHDAHMTIVLNAVRCLRQNGFSPRGKLKLLFQPAEETGEGALSFIRKGVIDDIDFLLGIHLRPVQELPLGKASAAIYHGATAQLRGEIRGVQSHAARPHLGVNVIDSLAAVVNAVNAVKTNPYVPQSAKVTQASAGSGSLNTVPDYAVFGLDLRSQTNEGMDDLIRRVRHGAIAAASANGADATLDIATRTVAASPNPQLETIVGEAIREVLGAEGWSPPLVTPGGEDFHYYALGGGGKLSATMIGLGAGLRPGLHHPEMTFDLTALQHGVAIVAAATALLFGSDGAGPTP